MPEQNVTIKITVEDDGATSKLGAIKDKLSDINTIVGNIKGAKGLPAIASGVKDLVDALSGVQNVNMTNVLTFWENVGNVLSAIGRANIGKSSANLGDTAEQFTKIGVALSQFPTDLNGITQGAEGISKLSSALKAFGTISAENIQASAEALLEISKATELAARNGAGIDALQSGLKKLPSALLAFPKAGDFSGKIAEIKATFKELSGISFKGGSAIQGLANGLEKLPKAFRQFGMAKDYAEAIGEIAKTLNMLAPAVAEVAKYGNGIGALANGLAKLPAALSNFSSVREYIPYITRIKTVLKHLGKTVKKVDSDSTAGFRGLVSSLRTLSNISNQENLDTQLSALAESVKKFVASLESVTDEQAQKVYNLGVGLKGLVDASRGLEKVKENIAKSDGAVRGFDIFKSATKNLVGWLKKVPGWLKKIAKGFIKIASLPFRPLTNTITHLADKVRHLFRSVGRIGFYRLIRSGIKMVTEGAKEGIDNLYMWSQVVGDNFAPTMDHLASEFLYLKNSVGAAISPIIQMFEPVITELIHKFIELLNVFNQFVSMISGKDTYRRAIYYATTYGDQIEDSMKGAGKAAKELKDILMDFDELNLITTPKDRNSGNGADEMDYGLMFEIVDIDETLFDAINNSDWGDIGSAIANKIASVLNGIDWGTIKGKTNGFATELGTFLNGIFGSEDMFTSIGITVGEGLNTVTGAINTFISTTDWGTLGGNLAKGFQKFIDTADAEQIGRALVAPITGLAKTIHGFTQEMTVEDWKAVAQAVYETMTSALSAIPWESLIPDLVELTTGLVMAITAAIKAINSQWDKVKKGIKSADWETFFGALGDLIQSIFDNKVFQVVVGLAITGSIVSFGIEMAKDAFSRKLFASAVAKALGGTAVTGAGAGAGAGTAVGGGASSGGLLSGLGGGAGALPWIAVGVGIILAVKQAKVQIENKGKLINPDNVPLNKIGEALSGNDPSLSFTGPDDSRITNVINNLDEYNRKLKLLSTIQNPRMLGFTSTKEMADALSETFADLNGNDVYSVGRAGLQIDRLWGQWGTFLEGSSSGLYDLTNNGLPSLGSKIESVANDTTKSAGDAADNVTKSANDATGGAKLAFTEFADKFPNLVDNGVNKPVNDAADNGKDAGWNLGNNLTGETSRALLNNKTTLKKNGIELGEETGGGIATGLDNKKIDVKNKGNLLGREIKTGFDLGLAGDKKEGPKVWGKHIAEEIAAGISENENKVTFTVQQLAGKINESLAFSEPEKGPLSDFHTYMPDMIDLMVKGIRENQYKVENQVTSLASTVSGIRDISVDPMKGDSENRGMASDIYEANAEERALLRELIDAVRSQRLTISPSASLGKVVNQSARLYAGVTG